MYKYNVFERLYWDYFSPHRIENLKSIYEFALSSDYKIVTVEQFWDTIKSNNINEYDKFLINRHDIDSDPKCVKLIIDIEKDLNITSSFYFRLKTQNLEAISMARDAGCEVGYHYEELATLIKKNGWRFQSQINWEEVRSLFIGNFKKFKQSTGLPLKSVCSHGDFVNRIIGVPNFHLLTPDIKAELGIEVDVYESSFSTHTHISHSDINTDVGFSPYSPFISISQSIKVIHLLTHPRQLRVNYLANTKENLERVFQGFLYYMRIKNQNI
jgi:hypothetical protein